MLLLSLHLLALWFVAIGGPSTILPDIYRYVVDVHHLLGSTQFAELYTLAQAARGPNVMSVTYLCSQLAGWAGVAATLIPLLVPACRLTLLVGHFNERYPNARISRRDRRGLTPITIGLMFASATITDARAEPRLPRVPAHTTYCRSGPAQTIEP